jgi:hypothetical protein
MGWSKWAGQLMEPPASVLTRSRIRAAYGAAIAADVLQLALGPFGWVLADEILDVVAMLVMSRLIGFHPLLLPTFVIEFVPVADLLPTWTGCVALVVALRRRRVPPSAGDDGTVTIDVKPTSLS